MSKFHINKHGVPAPCHAKEGNCPLGGSEQHFDNIQDAQAYADSKSEQQHGLLPGIKGKINLIKEKISGKSYDKNLITENNKVDKVDLSMSEVGNGIEEGFISIDEAEANENELKYDKTLAKDIKADPANFENNESIKDARAEGYVSVEEAEQIANAQAYDSSLLKSTEVPEVDLRMEKLEDSDVEGYVNV